MESKIAFVINPNAGVKKKINIQDFITEHFPKDIPFDCIIWNDKDDFESIKQQLLKNNYSIVVACGGDGTVNQVASVVVNTHMALGILPLGSGNGLARSNKIPMDLKQALAVIAKGSVRKMDSAMINGIPYFCTAGVGFDALIANCFATSTKRGFATYINTTIKEFFNYKPNHYTITVDGVKTNVDAFLITIANAGQWGNDVYIAPGAKLDDGLLRVSILKPFSKRSIPAIGLKLFLKKIDTAKNFMALVGKKIEIEFDNELPVHFDGEPILVKDKLNIEVVPLSLNVVC
jgi:YegS/Rv2252/BmrU family lipid kinase